MTVDEKLDLILSKLDALAAGGGAAGTSHPSLPPNDVAISIAQAKEIKAQVAHVSYSLDPEGNVFNFTMKDPVFPDFTRQWKQPWNGQ